MRIKKASILLLALLAVALLPHAQSAATTVQGKISTSEVRYLPDQLIVKLKPKLVIMSGNFSSYPSSEVTINSPGVSNLNKMLGVIRVEKLIKVTPKAGISIQAIVPSSLQNTFIFFLPPGLDPEVAADFYAAQQDVEYAEPNYIYKTVFSPDDPYFVDGTQWALKNVSAEAAWDVCTGTKEVKICILDTGVDYLHPDLANNIWINSPEDINHNGKFDNWPSTVEVGGVFGDFNGIDEDSNGFVDDVIGYDFVSVPQSVMDPGEDGAPTDPDPMDFNGHGTHCSGIASAVTNNGIGVAGLGYRCSIMAVRAGFSSGGNGYLSDADIANGLYYAANNGADAVSMSFGGGGSTTMKNAIDYAYSKGCVLVAAAGNSNSSNFSYPAAYEHVISVAATDRYDQKAYFSSYGSWVDVSAPGYQIMSTLFDHTATPEHTYRSWSGTSMATPYVAGLAGLLKSFHRSWINDAVSDRIIGSTDNIDAINPSYMGQLGSGRINAYKALTLANLPPMAYLTSPETSTYYNPFSGTVEIWGTAGGENFKNYSLDFSPAASPDAWYSLVASIETPVTNGILVKWNTPGVNDGNYTVRLTATSTLDETSTRYLPILVENCPISEPDEGMLIGDKVQQLKGTISANNFTNYTLEWASGIDPSPGVWSASGISLASGGSLQVANGLIATWSPPASAGDYTLKLTINCSDRQDTKDLHFLKDNDLHPGWPYPTDFTVYTSPICEDIDGGDGGKMEVAAVTALNYNLVVNGGTYDNLPRSAYLVNDDGTTVPGWPKGGLYQISPMFFDRSACVGDIDGDGIKEVVTHDKNYLFAWRPNGTLITGFPYPLSTDNDIISLFDVNQDGKAEILAYSGLYFNNNLHLLRYSGTALSNMPGWPVAVNEGFFIDVGDINNDGSPEVVTTGWRTQKVYAFRANGSSLPGFPKTLPDTFQLTAGPVLADTDGDEDLEIIVINFAGSDDPHDGEYYVIHHDGSVAEGYPIKAFASVVYPPVLGDIDRDGKLEMVGASFGTGPNYAKIFAVNVEDGTPVPGFPYNASESEIFFAPAIADFDGDGDQEIAFSGKVYWPYPSYKTQGRMHMIRHDGTVFPGWPKAMHQRTVDSTCQFSTPAIADIDQNGKLELVIGDAYYTKRYPKGWFNGGKLIAWDMPGTGTVEWQTYNHDRYHTGRYGMEFDPPYVLTTYPSPDSYVLPINAQIGATFNEHISTRTAVMPSNFRVFGTKSGVHLTHPTYVTAESTVTFNQEGLFMADETVLCTVEGEVQDRFGNKLARYYSPAATKYTFTFHTADISLSGITLKDLSSGNPLYTNNRMISLEAQNIAGTPETMIASEDPGFSGASYEAFRNPTTFEISSGDGLKTVYYKIRNPDLKVSQTVEASITLDTVSPEVLTAVPAPNTTIKSLQPLISAAFSDTILSGDSTEDAYFMVFGSKSGAHLTHPSYQSPQNLNTIVLSQEGIFSAGETVTCNISGSVRDKAGNAMSRDFSWSFSMSQVALDSLKLTNPRTGRERFTNSRTISVEVIGVIGSPDYLMISEEADFSGATWEAYSIRTQFLLSPGEGIKTVYYKLKSGDYASDPVSGSITLDTTSPEITSAYPQNGAVKVPTPSRLQVNFNEAATTEPFDIVLKPAVALGLPQSSTEGASIVFENVNWLHFTRYLVTVEGAEDLAGNPASNLPYTFSFTTISDDTSGPDIRARFDGTAYTDGAMISSLPRITANITDASGVDPSSIHIIIEGLGTFAPDTFEAPTMAFDVESKLSPRAYLITIEASDISEPPNRSSLTCRVKVTGGGAKIVGSPASYPAVFKPLSKNPSESTLKITYNLSSPADIDIMLYDIGGNLAMRRKFGAGSAGGRAGYNTIDWSGVSDVGKYVGNGIYILKITSGGKILGTAKIVVYD